ncbi:MAG: hypothetical protein KBS81_10665 [Spirochaetales bacterium]|nr:hypothetical protein [Candidatus Physcosoma equi]
MEHSIKNGLFKHTLEEKETFVAIKLFVNGWAVTDRLGNIKETIRREDGRIQSSTWSAFFVEEEVKALRGGGVKEVHIQKEDGKEYVFTRDNGNYLLGSGVAVEGIESRKTLLVLPDELSPLDAMVFFAIFRLSEETAIVV